MHTLWQLIKNFKVLANIECVTFGEESEMYFNMIAYKLIVKLIVSLVRGFKNIFAGCKQHVVLVLFYNKIYWQTN